MYNFLPEFDIIKFLDWIKFQIQGGMYSVNKASKLNNKRQIIQKCTKGYICHDMMPAHI